MEVNKAFMKTKENGENIYKMLNAWLRNCRGILAFMKKEIEYTKRETEVVVLRCSLKKVFLEISQNSKENTCVRVSFTLPPHIKDKP